tara:strand:- start:1670 stop:2338 length:669 start_codon:yes stop_codon:yes gene_type:complete
MLQRVLLFSKDKLFNKIISDLLISLGSYEIEIVKDFQSEKNSLKFNKSDIPIFYVSEKNILDDFIIFLSSQSYKGSYIVFNSNNEEINMVESKALLFDTPFVLSELLQALSSIRIQRQATEYHDIKFKKLFLNMTAKSLSDSRDTVKLTDKEIKIFWHLIKEKNSIVSQGFLLNKVWGYREDIETKTLTTHIYTIRKKLNCFNNIFSIENFEEGYCIKFKPN